MRFYKYKHHCLKMASRLETKDKVLERVLFPSFCSFGMNYRVRRSIILMHMFELWISYLCSRTMYRRVTRKKHYIRTIVGINRWTLPLPSVILNLWTMGSKTVLEIVFYGKSFFLEKNKASIKGQCYFC